MSKSTDVDVMVIGAGGAGAIAAAAAAEEGSRVLLVEAGPSIGGSTGMAIGSITAGRSRLQLARTQSDSVESHHAELRALSAGTIIEGSRDDVLARHLVEWAPVAIDWLEDHGIRISTPILEAGHSYPRMHMLLPNASVALHDLVEVARAQGAEVMTRTRATRIVRTGDSFEVVVEGDKQSIMAPREVVARSVVLASGDSSAELSTIQRPPMNPQAMGDGRRLASSLGGALIPDIRRAISLRRLTWPHIELRYDAFEFGGRLEDAQGNVLWHLADGSAADFAAALTEYGPGFVFFVFDVKAIERLAAENPVICTYPQIGFAQWGDLVSRGDVRFEVEPRSVNRQAVVGPFALFTALTDGAVVVGEDLVVVDSNGVPIPGLFAAGAAGWGASRLQGHGHHLSWSFASGLTAGRSAAHHVQAR